MTPTLKAPGAQRLKLKYDALLSNVGLNFNLRRDILSVESYIHNRGLPDQLSGQIRDHFNFLAKSAAFDNGAG
jgi:hypothetical protein